MKPGVLERLRRALRPRGSASGGSGEAPTLALLAGALLLALLPWLSAWWEAGELPSEGRALLAAAVASAFAVAFGLWVLRLLRRERRLVREHMENLESLTLTDPLTGLGNRRSLERDLGRAVLRSRRLDTPLTLLFLDVDDLKLVNDRFGHAEGDDTLRVVGQVVRSGSREAVDAGYRVGGDEFVVILIADRAGAEVVARRMLAAFMERSPHASTFSVGLVEWDGRSSTSDLLNEADRLMYRNKHMGRRATAAAREDEGFE
jgi:diguanylate cyclase (GGDEF)-like protein